VSGSAEFLDTVFAAHSLSFKGTFGKVSFLLKTVPSGYKTVSMRWCRRVKKGALWKLPLLCTNCPSI